jgi:hypothetical protein
MIGFACCMVSGQFSVVSSQLLVAAGLSLTFASQMPCHPERSLPRSLRQTESKDLRLFFDEYPTHRIGCQLLIAR